MSAAALKLNYYALCICILSEKTPDKALRDMRIAAEPLKSKDSDIDEILRLKKNHTWRQVAELYGVSDHAIQKRVARALKGQKIS